MPPNPLFRTLRWIGEVFILGNASECDKGQTVQCIADSLQYYTLVNPPLRWRTRETALQALLIGGKTFVVNLI
jgi:hypothetical protein